MMERFDSCVVVVVDVVALAGRNEGNNKAESEVEKLKVEQAQLGNI